MAGEVKFYLADLYGTGYTTTEETVPEAEDRQALVDDQNAAVTASDTGKKKIPMAIGIIALLVIVGFVGGRVA